VTDLGAAAKPVKAWSGKDRPRAAIVLGSGLGALAGKVDQRRVLAYRDIPGFPQPTVAGHSGELVFGSLDGVPVLLQSGRFHLYEGHDPAVAALPARLFGELGIGVLILTNAAGGIRPTFKPPLLMLIADHLNLMFRNPLLGPVASGEQRFPDMSATYDPGLRQTARDVALERGIALEEGVYAGLLGPNYETPAEIRMLARLGADAVGMSTVPEAIAARARGTRVLGISTITNLAAGISPTKLAHEEVLEAGRAVADRLESLIRGIVARLE